MFDFSTKHIHNDGTQVHGLRLLSSCVRILQPCLEPCNEKHEHQANPSLLHEPGGGTETEPGEPREAPAVPRGPGKARHARGGKAPRPTAELCVWAFAPRLPPPQDLCAAVRQFFSPNRVPGMDYKLKR